MNEYPSSLATITERISVLQSKFGGRPRLADSVLGGMGGSTTKADSASSGTSFNTMVDRLVSQSTGGGTTTDAVNDLLAKFLAQERPPVGTRAAPVTTVSTTNEQVAPSTSSSNGERIVALASKYLGTPYVWGGEEPSGFDCSGLIQHVYAEVGIDLPRVSRDQARVGVAVPSLDAAVPGDLVAFGTPVDHIGIYAGNGTMIVAPHTGDVVKVQRVTREPVTIRRIVAADTPTPTKSASADLAAGEALTTVGASNAIDPSDPASTFRPMFQAAEERYGVSAELLEAVAKQESQFDPTAVSPAGAQGLMQLMPATARALGVDAFEPAAAIDGAARLLGQHLRKFDSVPLALAAYNAGAGAVQRFNGIPPYKETQNYVAEIVANLADRMPTGGTAGPPEPLTLAVPSSMADASLVQPWRSAPFLFNDRLPTNTQHSLSSAPTRRFGSNGRSNTGLFLERLTTPTTSPATTPATVPAVGTAPATAAVASPKPIVGPGSEGWVLPAGKPESPAKGAWGPSTQTQVTSVGGEATVSWAASGLLGVANPAEVTAIAPSATGPVAKGVLKILQNATPAQMISPEFRQTLNDVNRDALGLPNAPDVIPVQPPAPPTPAPAAAAPSGTLSTANTATPAATAGLASPLTGANAIAPAARTTTPTTASTSSATK